MRVSAPSRELAADVERGLRAQPKRLPPKYFYDALGSALFDAITRLPWYLISRSEHRLLARHGPAITAALPTPGASGVTLVELGCGGGDKTARIADAFASAGLRGEIHLVDMSSSALRAARRRLRRFRGLAIETHDASYEEGLSRMARSRGHAGASLVLFLGSNIGNFDPPDAVHFLGGIGERLTAGDCLLLGVDLVKPKRDLLLAYDDPLGVTGAFNKNLLVRLNRELDATFDLTAFDHQAQWNEHARRVEMHLVSRCPQRVAIRALDLVVDFDAGESIWTESSYKYEPDEVVSMGLISGFALEQQWIDQRARFALTLFRKGNVALKPYAHTVDIPWREHHPPPRRLRRGVGQAGSQRSG